MSAVMTSEMSSQPTPLETEDPRWTDLYKVAGAASFIAPILFMSTVVLALIVGQAAPTTPIDWLTLLHDSRTAGLAQLAFTDLIGAVLLVPVVLALYIVLKRFHMAYAALAVLFALVALALLLSTNSNYSLLYLSSRYEAAVSEAEQAQLLAAAEASVVAGTWGTGALAAGFLFEGALLVLCVLMLRSSAFGKGISYLGLAAHGLDLAHSAALLIMIPVLDPDTASNVGIVLLALGGSLQLIWYPLVARKLLQLGRLPTRGAV